MKKYVIYSEDGSYSDCSMTNLFLVDTKELAEHLVERLNKAFKYWCEFRNNELEDFRKQWDLNNPSPRIREFTPEENKLRSMKRLQPLAPEHLRKLPKEEKKNSPEYAEFVKALREYEVWKTQVNKEDEERYKVYYKLKEQHGEQYKLAADAFKQENLMPILNSFFSDEYREKFMPLVFNGYDRFSFDEIELI